MGGYAYGEAALLSLAMWAGAVLWLNICVALGLLLTPLVALPALILPVVLLLSYPTAGLAMLLSLTIWQNLVISIWSPLAVDNATVFNALQGMNFAVSAIAGVVCWLILLLKPRSSGGQVGRRVRFGLLLVFAFGASYLLYGTAISGIKPAMVYFRTIFGPFMFLPIGLVLGAQMGWRELRVILLVNGLLIVGYGFVELLATRELYELVNLPVYKEMKRHGVYLGVSINDFMLSIEREFFNTPWLRQWGLVSYRISGPSIHVISFGYLLCFVALWAMMTRAYILVPLPMLLMFIIGTKGSAIMLIGTIMLWALNRWILPRRLLFPTIIATVSTYIASGVMLGVIRRDYHVLGLIGGIRGFFANPLGHGLGFGGNLSRVEDDSIDWLSAQHAGYANYGVESSIGVILYQVGIPGLFLIVAVFWLLCRWLRYERAAPERGMLNLLLPISGFFLFANLVFQEEALSPYALGFALLFAGIRISRLENDIAEARRNWQPEGET